MNCAEIRKVILSLEKPFCISDLFNIFSQKSNDVDRDLILEVLDELYDCGLVEYINVEEAVWAFKVK